MSTYEPTRRGFLRALAAAGAASPLLARAERLEAALPPRRLPEHLRPEDEASVQALRSQYMLAPDLTYLNHASIGTVPSSVHEAHVGYLELCESHPSLYVWGRVWRDVLEDTRAAAAGLIGSRPDDLAVTHNTTEGFNILAHGIPLRDGDEVLFSSLNHPGASVAWRAMGARRGYSVRQFAFPVERVAEMSREEVVEQHARAVRPETRVLVLPHVDNVVGLVHPLAEIADAVRSRGVEYVVVDGAQSVGMIPVDLATSGVDAYSASPHKWLQAPKGLGLFWASADLRGSLPRMWYRTPGQAIEASARKYEDYSTRAWPAVVALGDAIGFQGSIGESEKQRRYAALRRGLEERVREERRLRWRSPTDPDLGSMIVAVQVDGASAAELGPRLLESSGVVVRAFGDPLDTLRLSPNLATTDDELDRVVGALAGASP